MKIDVNDFYHSQNLRQAFGAAKSESQGSGSAGRRPEGSDHRPPNQRRSLLIGIFRHDDLFRFWVESCWSPNGKAICNVANLQGAEQAEFEAGGGASYSS